MVQIWGLQLLVLTFANDTECQNLMFKKFGPLFCISTQFVALEAYEHGVFKYMDTKCSDFLVVYLVPCALVYTLYNPAVFFQPISSLFVFNSDSLLLSL